MRLGVDAQLGPSRRHLSAQAGIRRAIIAFSQWLRFYAILDGMYQLRGTRGTEPVFRLEEPNSLV